jgi:integrase
VGKLRVSKASELFLAWAAANRSPGTVAGYRHYLKRFESWSKDIEVMAISPAMVETWSSKWHAVQAVQRLCNWLHREARLIKTNPLIGMKRPPAGMRRRVLNGSESAAMLRGAPRSLRHLLVALRETIGRPIEIREATFEAIRSAGDRAFTIRDLVAGECLLLVDGGKGFNRRKDNDEIRIIPISPRLGRLIARLYLRSDVGRGTIFRDEQGRQWTGRKLRESMRTLRRRAKLDPDWRGERVVAYTLRHTSATGAVAAGVRDAMLSAIMGHTTPRMTRRYIHLQPDMIQEGMKRIVEAKTARKAKSDRPGSPPPRPE